MTSLDALDLGAQRVQNPPLSSAELHLSTATNDAVPPSTDSSVNDKDDPNFSSSSAAGNDSFAHSTAGSVIDHGESGGSFDSSFEALSFSQSERDGESSFEVVDSSRRDEEEERAESRQIGQQAKDDAHDESDDAEGRVGGVEHFEGRPDDSFSSSSGLLNPEAPTFEAHSATTHHHLVFPPGTSFNTITVDGKDEIGELTADAKAALTDLGLKSIPAMHGPPNLPYARCPSGIDAFVLPPGDDEALTFDPEAPPRPAHIPLPLPGNSRFVRSGRQTAYVAPRSISGPAALEAGRMRARNFSHSSVGSNSRSITYGPVVAQPMKKLLPPPRPPVTAPTAPSTTSTSTTFPFARPTPLPHLQQQQALYEMQQLEHQRIQQAHFARQAQLAYLAQLHHAQSTAHGGGPPPPPPPPPPRRQPHPHQPHQPPYPHPTHAHVRTESYPNHPPSPFLQTQPQQPPLAHAAPSMYPPSTYHPSTYPSSRRGSVLVAPGMQDIDSLVLLQQLAAQQQAQVQLMSALQQQQQQVQQQQQQQSGSRHSSYSTAPDYHRGEYETWDDDDDDDDDDLLPTPVNFYPWSSSSVGLTRAEQLDRRRAVVPRRSSDDFRPSEAYLQRRRQSAAPTFPTPGGRKPSLSPAVEVGPRRASVAPQARLGNENVQVLPPPPESTSSRLPPPSQSRRGSIVHTSNVVPALAVSAPTPKKPTSKPSGGGGGGGEGKSRVFSDVGNSIALSRGGRSPPRPRHASDTAVSWRRRAAAGESKKEAPTNEISVALPLLSSTSSPSLDDNDAWNVVESVAEALLAPCPTTSAPASSSLSVAKALTAAEEHQYSNASTPRAGTPNIVPNAAANAGKGKTVPSALKKPSSKKHHHKSRKNKSGGTGTTGAVPPPPPPPSTTAAVVAASSS